MERWSFCIRRSASRLRPTARAQWIDGLGKSMPVRPPLNRLSQPGKSGNPYQICEGDAQWLRPCEPSRRIHQAQVPKNRGKRAGEKQGRNCQSPEYDALGHIDCVRKKRLNCAREPKEQPMQSNRCRTESKAAHHASGRGKKRCKMHLVHYAFMQDLTPNLRAAKSILFIASFPARSSCWSGPASRQPSKATNQEALSACSARRVRLVQIDLKGDEGG